MEKGKLSKDDLELDSDSDLEGFEEWHGIASDGEVDLSEDDESGEDEDGSDEEGAESSGEEEEEASEDENGESDEDGSEDGEASDSNDGSEVDTKKVDEAPAAEPAAPAGRYIPPHLRAAQLGEKAATDGAKVAERIKLERKAQGLLNK